ncbi:hypothetical protein GCM10011514_20020 [Emticicia aquatilis]|uniref:Uncharacterized protein n=1 Tax=Emticicia aquatilis TaxID=1537369 RepID=A0A916YRB1_9BACT|nr:hypothetical protein [Emticicia aquatilis]GGD55921.1 hypothetical protein GCM10011514_20020 [Emticicia aquatilis]
MKIFLPILWFVLNVLSFNTLRSPYEQGEQGSEHSKISFWSQSSSQHSSNKNSQIYFLAEEFEENVEEDADGESEIQFLDYDLADATSSYRFLPTLTEYSGSIRIAQKYTSPANNRAKFIIYQNIRI